MKKHETTKHRKRTKKEKANRRAKLLRERQQPQPDELSPARQAFKDL